MAAGELTPDASRALDEAVRWQRVVGDVDRGERGPLVLVTGGVHGNEPSGVRAAQRVVSAIEEHDLPLRGRLLCLAGNLAALRSQRRFLQSDLNRAWTEERVRRLDRGPAESESVEDGEQRELLGLFRRAQAEHAGSGRDPRVHLLDLHSSSAAGAPFSCIGDTLQNRRVALRMPIPLILGLEEIIEGSLLEYLSDRGHVAVAVEGGQHHEVATVEHHEAAIWIFLAASGALRPEEVPDIAGHARRLKDAARGRPGVVEILHRQAIGPRDRFTMEPGFKNFEPVRPGQLLARDRRGDVRSDRHGVLLLPLYQGQGEDGFFLGREVRRFWLRLSALLRRLRLGRVLPLLPGIQRAGPGGDRLRANPRVARFLTRETFHLFGFRQCREEGGRLAFTRRRERDPLPL